MDQGFHLTSTLSLDPNLEPILKLHIIHPNIISHHKNLNTQSDHTNIMSTMLSHMLNPLFIRNGMLQLHKTLIHPHNHIETLLVQAFGQGQIIEEKRSNRNKLSRCLESPIPVCFKG